jgi:purine-binding chemotaxis protein CheW
MQESEIAEVQYGVEEDSQVSKYLTFSLKNEEYGIDISDVREIIGIQKITEVPDMPHSIRGVINLRGKIIPVLDIRIRFSLEEKEYNERTSIIVVNIQDTDVGLIVDAVSEVLDINNSDIEETSEVGRGDANNYIKGYGKVSNSVKILLDIQSLLFGHELLQINDNI